MRLLPAVMFLMLLVPPTVARGQSLELRGSAGPTMLDAGNSVAAGVGLSPTSWLTIVVNGERTHVSSRITRDGQVVSASRGGTLLLGTTEVRFGPFGRRRLGPFALAGLAAGVSRPNVNDLFPHRVTNGVLAMFFGGGVAAPLGERLAVFADARIMVGAEGREGMVGVAPVRVGLTWRF
jgi:hypothetical protein